MNAMLETWMPGKDQKRSAKTVISISALSGSHAYILIPALDTPEFIYECRRTLLKIEDILKKFGQGSALSTDTSANSSLVEMPTPRRFKAKDLKWPLKKSKTMQLIETLERHKSTCTIALAENGLVGVHNIFEQTKLSNYYLSDIKAKQEKILELNVTSEQSRYISEIAGLFTALL